eukprot:4932594-Amphidinium_carterae.1
MRACRSKFIKITFEAKSRPGSFNACCMHVLWKFGSRRSMVTLFALAVADFLVPLKQDGPWRWWCRKTNCAPGKISYHSAEVWGLATLHIVYVLPVVTARYYYRCCASAC